MNAKTAAAHSAKKISTAKIVKLAAIPVALLASAGIVAQASYSAYSATTVNPTSNWTSGTVALADDDNNTALFTASNLKPGATGTKCIQVSSTGSLASAVKLYGTNYATTNGLASVINIKIEQGSGATTGNCSNFVASTANPTLYDGTLAAFGTGGSAKTSFSTGVGDWVTTGAGTSTNPETRSYRFTYTLSSAATNDSQGGTASIGFTWEAQNN